MAASRPCIASPSDAAMHTTAVLSSKVLLLAHAQHSKCAEHLLPLVVQSIKYAHSTKVCSSACVASAKQGMRHTNITFMPEQSSNYH